MNILSRLIKLVKKHKFLYNKDSLYFGCKIKVRKTWDKIGRKLNLSGSECKAKWMALRSYYNAITLHQSKQIEVCRWKYKKQLSFLGPNPFWTNIFTSEHDYNKKIPLSRDHSEDRSFTTTSSDNDEEPDSDFEETLSSATYKQNVDNSCLVNSNRNINFGIYYGNIKSKNEIQSNTEENTAEDINEEYHDSSEDIKPNNGSQSNANENTAEEIHEEIEDIDKHEQIDNLLTFASSAVKELCEKPTNSTIILFKGMANKINEANLTPQQIMNIELELCRLVFSKLANRRTQRKTKNLLTVL